MFVCCCKTTEILTSFDFFELYITLVIYVAELPQSYNAGTDRESLRHALTQ